MRATFEEYATRYDHVSMERRDGIVLARLHTEGGPLVWGDGPHTELGYAFEDLGRDPDNRVVILTGTGDEFIARLDTSWVGAMNPAKWDKIYQHGRRLLDNLLAIEVPVIAAVNGPATVHAELAVLADIVLAADTAVFRDAPHFRFGTVPGDGVHVVWPMLLGPNRGRHFLLTGRRLAATEARELGVVAEVLAPAELVDRAWALAAELARQPDMCLRYTRDALTRVIRHFMADHLDHGLALEGLAAYESWPE
ncbi:MAG TPA: enoyl-CoA hydratase/isomerase family protein [Acidimicrobiales bacterium]|nr:enoyl-CoA hydratase/isomerase family protein [Acidimicrobiales bacterium]